MAFDNEEDAKNYAYNYEKGIVEKQVDGSFRYNGSLDVKQKIKYNSAWNLTDALNYFAEQAVQQLCFDMSDEFTVLTLDQEIIDATPNLRMLELSRSVVIYADSDQKKLLTNHQSLPFLNNKKDIYLQLGLDGKDISSTREFEFIRDKYGCDSAKVTITDVADNTYEIEYGEGIEKQLLMKGCATGVVTITEETIYHDSTSYNAVFLNAGENTAIITILSEDDEGKRSLTIDQKDNGHKISCAQFSITDIHDELDPYTVVFVTKDGKTWHFISNQTEDVTWSEKGKYEIRVVNRLGYSFVFTVEIN